MLEIGWIKVARVEGLGAEAGVGHHDHLAGEKVDALTERDLLVGVRIDDLEERLDPLRLEVRREGL